MTEQKRKVIAAATDGACSGNPGPGGWAVLLRFEDGSVEEFGAHVASTTNNRMELQAGLEALKRLRLLSFHSDLTIRTDSKYLIDGFTKWMTTWKKNGWRTSSRKPVINKDLWLALDHARLVQVPFEYVKGHSGDHDNDRVDQIAVSFSKGISINLTKTNCRKGNSLPTKQTIENPDIFDLTPSPLQKVLTRLEIADHFAKGAYILTLEELAQLVDQPVEKLRKLVKPWLWRDWLVEPVGDNNWRLHRNLEKIISPEDCFNE